MRTPSRSRPTSLFRYSPLVAALAGVLAHDVMAAPCTPSPPTLFCVTNTASSGAGSLAQAFADASNAANCANTTPTIAFDIAGTGPFMISPSFPLVLECNALVVPPKSIHAILDGTSQTGYSPNTSSSGFNAANQIIINGASVMAYGAGLQVNDGGYGASLTIKGVDFRNFTYGGTATAISGPVNLYGSRIEASSTGITPYQIDPDGSTGPQPFVFGAIGSPALADRNVLRNVNESIRISYGGHVNIVNNLIGTDDSGTASGGAGVGVGIRLQGGFSVNITNNIIGGGNNDGIQMSGQSGVDITGNKIGVSLGGTPVPNAGAGISSTFGFSTRITNNTIAHNGADGIDLAAGGTVEVRGNRIYANGVKPINLTGTGTPLANDTNDIDSGSNGLQNHPLMFSVIKNAGANTTTINWSLNSTTSTTFMIDFFSNPGPTAIPEARVYLDPVALGFPQATGATGGGNFTSGLTVIPGLHDYITATATSDPPLPVQTSEVGAVTQARGVALSPTSIDFGNTVVSSTSSPQTATLTSLGSGPVTLTYIGDASAACYGGSAPCSSGAFVCSTTCATSTPYAAGPACTFTASFQPLVTGPDSTTISICDNADASSTPRLLTLIGNGITPPPVSVMPSSHDFGNVENGGQSPIQAFTFHNPGSTPASLSPFTTTGPYTVVANTCTSSLSPMASCAADVRFNPVGTGPFPGTLSTTAGPGGATAGLNGTGVAGPPPAITPPSIDMGSVVVGQSSATPGTFTLANPAILATTISSITASAPFNIAGTTCGATLAGGTSCLIDVGFTPVAVGPASGTMTVLTGAGTITRGLTGNGATQPPVTISPPNNDFGSVPVGFHSPPFTFTINNPGAGSQALSSFTVTSPFLLHATTCGASLPSASSCTADVKFAPGTTGSVSGTISATTGTGPISSALTGNGTIAATLQISPPNHDYGVVLLGAASAPTAFTITNPAPATITLSGLSVTGPYEIVSTTCSTSLASAGSCGANVRFVPVATGVVPGSLIASSSIGTATASLVGNGQRVPFLSVPATPIEFGSLVQGSASVSHPVTLRNTGNAILAINSISVAAPFTLTNGCGVSLGEGAECTATVNFNPTTLGDFNSLLSISTNAPAGVVQIPVHAAVQQRPEPQVRVVPRTIGFGNRVPTVPGAAQRVTVTNAGGSTASLDFALRMPHFTLSRGSCGPTLAPAQSCEATVNFEPTAFGPKRATLEVISNSPDSPQTVELTGVGCRPYPSSPGRGTGALSCSP